ncbi:MAG: periplasmic heavy metal sensor [Candidatus Aminicenantes bacterium]|nr:periplasmic heavy metal sensor [Candidatus Aminicenantes bacterium]NIM81196.1 periplasmic heavy metal sensor [Candidatus Aminicenantes bacterium]NIN20571.1 periplasmic heavy metal sensor [Candidatus Aminicenantes bacterium]NIN44350.1 periplasmic heavy metal sensor [Candidatus Aminicenantes bacterium]NIN87169.1 periplasmic heavy metal sensor [Candidatus Aminicenantes bacterium]
MKTKILFILLVISLAFNVGVLFKLIAKSPRQPRANTDECIHWKDCSICLELYLTPQQIQELEKHLHQFKEEIAPFKGQLEKERQGLFQLLKKDSLDESETHRHVQTITGLQSRIQDKFIRHLFRIKSVFSSDQQRKLYNYFHQELCCKKQASCSSEAIPQKSGCKENQGSKGGQKTP